MSKEESNCDFTEIVEKNRSRLEERKVWASTFDWLDDRTLIEQWAGIKSALCVQYATSALTCFNRRFICANTAENAVGSPVAESVVSAAKISCVSKSIARCNLIHFIGLPFPWTLTFYSPSPTTLIPLERARIVWGLSDDSFGWSSYNLIARLHVNK